MPTITATQAAKRRAVSKSTISKWLCHGLRHQRFANSVLIDSADLDAYEPGPVGNPQVKPGWGKGRRRKSIAV